MKLSELKKADHLAGDCGNKMDRVPDWMDFERVQRGREFFIKHMAAILFSLHLSLVSGLSIINLLNPLVFTEKTDTPEKAFKRYFQTFLHVVLWQADDVWEVPEGQAHKSVRLVRNMHNSVASRMNKDKKNGEKLFLSQYDMGLVQSGFFGAVIMYPEEFGIVCTREELSDYVFVWRSIGYLLGINDKYNICSEGLDEAYNICKEIENELLIPSLKDPPKEFDKMSIAYVRGTNIPTHVEFMTRDALFALMHTRWNIPSPKLSILDTLRVFYLKSVMFLIRWCPFFEQLSNRSIMKQFRNELHQLKL